jgi:MFS family permease
LNDRVASEARPDLPIRRNTVILAATMAVNSAVLQLVAAVSSLTFVLVTGVKGLLGLGPAIFLTASGLTAVGAGRLMDQLGRMPVITGGFALGATGCALTALATRTDSAVAVVAGFAFVGASTGIALLIRTAAGDMYPPARRARGISYVLFGSVFGAILGPTVFSPMFAGKKVAAHSLTVPWLAAAGIAVVALVLVQFVRPDPQRIAELLGSREQASPSPATAAPLRELIRRPGVIPAMLAALTSMAVMVSVMNLTGYVVVEHHHHPQHSVFLIVGAHVFGMYALVLVMGQLIDKIGRTPALQIGLVTMALSTSGLLWTSSVFATALWLLGLGIGWNISFVAATAQLADRTSPVERGKLLGFNDLLGALCGAGLALLGGYALNALGAAAVAVAVFAAWPGQAQGALYRHFHSRPDLKPPPVEILKRTPRASLSYIFIAPKKDVEQVGPLILDNRGRIVWFHPIDADGMTDFRVQVYRGRPVLTWWRGRTTDGRSVAPYAVYDSSYRPIAYIQPQNDLGGDIHEFLITRRNTALITVSHLVTFAGRRVLEGGIQELDIRTGRLLFQWLSTGHVPLSESYYRPPRDRSRTFDYFHINSIQVDRDGNLIVSARNTHTIYKISRRTGRILWRLGGKSNDFALGQGVRFAWQHDARRHPGGTLSLFDNEAGPQVRPQSRGELLRLDTKHMRATLLRNFVHRPPLVSVDQGNMQLLPNGHYFVGWGHQNYFTEFGPKGQMLLDGRFGRGHVDSYRAYRFHWVGRPAQPPAVAIARNTVYASWNGATEVAAWQLLAGPDRRRLQPILTVPKRGFETAIPLGTDAPWIAMRALDARGRVLRRSVAVQND